MSRTCNSAMAAPTHAVQVVANTWVRDSHDLFDFESQQLQNKTFTVQRSMTCVRSGTNVEMTAESAEQGADSLVRVVERSGTFWVDKACSCTCSKKLWMVVKDVAPRGLRLSRSDVIKLGRFRFRVRQLVTAECGDVQPDLGLDDSNTSCCTVCPDPAALESKTCRICLLEGPGEDDPLITPCQCKGSIEYVHLKCLRYWTKSRLALPDSPLGSYFYRPLSCELCKTAYPTYLLGSEAGSKPVPLMEVPKTQPPYIVLENLVRDTRQHARGLHVVSLAEKALMLGRGHESDVRIADVSISRCHAMIRFEKGQFLLQDNDSKFGTLVALRRPRQIEASRPLSLQIGRTVLSLSLSPGGAVEGDWSTSAVSPPPPPPQPQQPTPPTMGGPITEEERQRCLRLLPLTTRRSRGAGTGTSALPEIGGGPQLEEDHLPIRRRASF